MKAKEVNLKWRKRQNGSYRTVGTLPTGSYLEIMPTYGMGLHNAYQLRIIGPKGDVLSSAHGAWLKPTVKACKAYASELVDVWCQSWE